MLIPIFSCTNKISEKNYNKCYHIIFYKSYYQEPVIYKIKPEQFLSDLNVKSEGKKTKKPTEISYYLGKICIENNKLNYYEVHTFDEMEAKSLSYGYMHQISIKNIEFLVSDIQTNPKRNQEFYTHQKNQKIPEYIIKEFTKKPFKIIKQEVGEKYYKNDWSKSRGDELKNAIIDYDIVK